MLQKGSTGVPHTPFALEYLYMALGKVISNRFRNENGNDIYVRVTEEPIQGVPGILLYIAGPDSDAEMHITRQEGIELLEVLSKLLRSRRRRV